MLKNFTLNKYVFWLKTILVNLKYDCRTIFCVALTVQLRYKDRSYLLDARTVWSSCHPSTLELVHFRLLLWWHSHASCMHHRHGYPCSRPSRWDWSRQRWLMMSWDCPSLQPLEPPPVLLWCHSLVVLDALHSEQNYFFIIKLSIYWFLFYNLLSDTLML